MNARIIVYVLITLLVVGIALATFFPGIFQAWKDAGKSGTEKCKPAPGYTEESWKEHMSHHSDIYKECLQ